MPATINFFKGVNIMKRCIAIVLAAAVMLFAFAGCSAKEVDLRQFSQKSTQSVLTKPQDLQSSRIQMSFTNTT